MKKNKALISVLLVSTTAFVALAQTQATTSQVTSNPLIQLFSLIASIVNTSVPYLVGIVVLGFLWFLVTYFWKGSKNAEAKGNAVKWMGYAIMALFILVAVWGVVGLIGSLLGISPTTSPTAGVTAS